MATVIDDVIADDPAETARRRPRRPAAEDELLTELTAATADYLHLVDLANAARWRQRALIHRAIKGGAGSGGITVSQADVARAVMMTREHIHRITGIVDERPRAFRTYYLGDRALYDALRDSAAYRAAARAADQVAIATDDRTEAEVRRHTYDHETDPVFALDATVDDATAAGAA